MIVWDISFKDRVNEFLRQKEGFTPGMDSPPCI